MFNRLRLKTKIKSLAAESRIVRLQEHKALFRLRWLTSEAKTPAWFVKRHGAEDPKPKMSKKQKAKCKALQKWIDENRTEADSEAQKAYDAYWGLTDYRKNQIRKESRAANLAYAFVRGVPYFAVEPSGCYLAPDWERVENIAWRFTDLGSNAFRAEFDEWMKKAKASCQLPEKARLRQRAQQESEKASKAA